MIGGKNEANSFQWQSQPITWNAPTPTVDEIVRAFQSGLIKYVEAREALKATYPYTFASIDKEES